MRGRCARCAAPLGRLGRADKSVARPKADAPRRFCRSIRLWECCGKPRGRRAKGWSNRPAQPRSPAFFRGEEMRTALLLIAATAALMDPPAAQAGHLFCDHCGCQQNCRKVCKLVCEKKKETTTEYTSECEDFCIPGPSHKCGVRYEHDECGGHPHRKIIWQPTCAKVHTRKKLVKKEVTKEVPDYKWVVEEYCCICGMLVKMERGDGKSGKDGAGGKSDGDKLDSGDSGGDKSNGDKPGSQGGKKRTGQVLPTETGPLVLLPSIREYGMPSFERWRDNAPTYGDDSTGSQTSGGTQSAGAPAAEKSAQSETEKTASDARHGQSPPPRRLFRALFVR